MKINKEFIMKNMGRRLYWSEPIGRGLFETRTGILTDITRLQICFDDSQDYKPFRSYISLRTTIKQRE